MGVRHPGLRVILMPYGNRCHFAVRQELAEGNMKADGFVFAPFGKGGYGGFALASEQIKANPPQSPF